MKVFPEKSINPKEFLKCAGFLIYKNDAPDGNSLSVSRQGSFKNGLPHLSALRCIPFFLDEQSCSSWCVNSLVYWKMS